MSARGATLTPPIREAVGAPGLTTSEWLHPTLDIFIRALPFTYGRSRQKWVEVSASRSGVRPAGRRSVRIDGDSRLGQTVLGALAIMA